MSAGGLLPEVVGSMTIGAGMGTSAAFAGGGQEVGAGLAGDGANGALPCQRGFVSRPLHSRPSVFDGDNVRLNLAVHSASPEPAGDRFRGDVGGFAEPRRVTRLDLAAQGRPLAVRHRWDTGR